MTKKLLSMFVLLCASFTQYAEASVAGHFQFVAGDVRVISADGKVRLARKGAEVNEGESITTNATASAQIRMVDEGLIVVRPDTRLKVTTFVFNGKADGSERSLFSLVKGGFRAITGIIGRVNKEHYKIETPTATIGIRGTDHEPTFIPNPLPGKVAIAEPGTYDKVNSGAAVLSTATGMVVINPNQAGFVPNIPNATPSVLAVMPAFYKVDHGGDEPKFSPGARLKEEGGASAMQPSTKNNEVGTPAIKKGAELVPTKAGVLESGGATKSLTGTNINPATKSGATLTPLNTGTAIVPTATGTSLTTLKQPSLNTLSPVTTIAPVTTTTKTLSTITPIVAPTTTIQPITTTIQPITTTIQPITTTIQPITTTIQPITTTIQPITTTIQPITTTIQPKTSTIQPITTFSDRRLKKNIKRVGTHPLGIGIYEFDYVWGEHATGVMADEVRRVKPDAVLRDASGYDMVDYSKLN